MTQSPYADLDPLSAPVGTRFVIKQHHATALHHDVRLEVRWGGAVTGLARDRGGSLTAGQRRSRATVSRVSSATVRNLPIWRTGSLSGQKM